MSSTNIYTEQKYVVYHITYSGDKFPQNYIGSTSLESIQHGYMGSVSSKKYKSLWNQELKENPQLFNLEIISYHDTRPAATYAELQIQKIFNVVKNPLFVNLAYASVNGYFGKDTSGKNNPMYGKKRALENNPMYGKQHTKKSCQKISESRLNKIYPNARKSYSIIDPKGNSFIITGLADFCRKNNLSAGHMSSIANGIGKSHKGWQCIKI